MSLLFSSVLKKVGETKYRKNGRLNITIIETKLETLTGQRASKGQMGAQTIPASASYWEAVVGLKEQSTHALSRQEHFQEE